jgi:hypothetical protein
LLLEIAWQDRIRRALPWAGLAWPAVGDAAAVLVSGIS